MKNLKKFFAVLVVLTLMVSSIVVPVSAAESIKYSDEAQKLYDLGLYKGISTEVFNPDLGSTLNRETGVVMLLRIVGLEKAALDMSAADVTAALSKFKDAKDISPWAKNQVAYGVKNGLIVGTTETTFGPKASLDSKAYCTLILRQLGYTVEAGAQYDAAAATLQEKGGLTAEQAADYANKSPLIKDDLVGISYGALKAVDKDGKALFDKLIEAGVFTAEKAAEVGLVSANIASVTATNGNISVTFDKDIILTPAAADFTVTQSVYAASATEPTTTTVTASVYGYTAATKTAELTVAPVTDAAAKTVYYSVAYKNGTPVTSAPIALATVTLSKAVSLSSKVVEAVLTEATNVAAVAGTTFTVKDSAGAVIDVTKAALAGYDTDNKTVLLTLASDTKAGSLYSLTVGSKTVNFGGKAPETTKPTIKDVKSTGFKEVTIEYSEPVVLDGTTVVIAEKYTPKTPLAVKSLKYNGKTKIVVETDEQKGSTLYGITVTGTADFSGNVMDKDESKTFGGTEKDTSPIKVSGAAANEPEEVIVKFNVNIDTATIAAGNFKVEEAYGTTKAVLPVSSARIATKDDKDLDGTTALTEAGAKAYVVISVPGINSTTLYKLTVSGLKSEAGSAMSTTSSETTTTFTGKSKPTDPFTVSISGDAATSNTLVEVTFANKVVKADAENVANYAIVEAYGTNKATLEVKSAELQSDGKTVKLTTASMGSNLYKITITGIKDIYGNSIKTEDSKNVLTFSGKAVAAKISKISNIAYDTGSDTVIVVTFDQAVGSTATDVSHYFINNDVGYPEAVETVSGAGNADKVKLTLPKLTDKKLYTLTVKGLENADGVAMDTAGISATFVGKGNSATLPQLTGVMAIDNQTLRIYFDRDVKDSTVDGKIWDSSTNQLKNGVLTFRKTVSSTTTDLDLEDRDEYAYQESGDKKNILIVRISESDATENPFASGTLRLIGNNTYIDPDNDDLQFAPKADDPQPIVIENVQALDKNTIRVYFNMPVYANASAPDLISFADINTTQGFGGDSALALAAAAPVDDTKRVYDFKVNGNLTNSTYYFNVDGSAVKTGNALIQDSPVKGYVGLKDENTSTDALDHVRQFVGKNSDPADIKDVYAVMTDNKTIKVIYPTNMDEALVETKGKYTLCSDSAGNTAVTMADNQPFAATHIGEVVYKEGDKTATITLNTAIKNGPVYVKFDKSLSNAVGTAFVKDGTSTIVKQFAINTADATKVLVKSVEYDSDARKLTITLNQKVNTANFADPYSAADFVADFKVTVQASATANYVLTADDIANTTGTTIAGTGFAGDKIVVTLNATINGAAETVKASEVGKVQFVGTGNLRGINGNDVDTDNSMTFAQ